MSKSGPTSMKVVWGYVDCHGGSIAYVPAVSNLIEKSLTQLKDQQTPDLGTVCHDLSGYLIVAADSNFSEIEVSTGKTKLVVRHELDGTIEDWRWQWQTDPNGEWADYDLVTTAFIQDAYYRRLLHCDLNQSQSPIPYVVDFHKKLQVRYVSGTRFPPLSAAGRPVKYEPFRPHNEEYIRITPSTQAYYHQPSAASFQLPQGNSGAHGSSSRTSSSWWPAAPGAPGAAGISHVTGVAGAVAGWNTAPGSNTGSSSSMGRSQKRSASLAGMKKSFKPSSVTAGSRKSGALHKSKSLTQSSNGDSDKQYVSKTAPHPFDIYFLQVDQLTVEEAKETCCICMGDLNESSGYGDQGDAEVVIRLRKCRHLFHRLCITAMASASNNQGLQCPTCKESYGEKTGICPSGNMTVSYLNQPVPGFPRSSRTIEIVYEIRNGTQGSEHPHPGQPYYANGFPRVGYLPDTPEGQKVLKMLQIAWKRKVTFTVGRSMTSGADDCVTWNEIHHKTQMGRGSFGYPDPEYLANVTAELKQFGITPEST